MNEIKPCFCGSTKIKIEKRRHSAGMDGSYDDWEFYCDGCGCSKSYGADGFYGRKYWKTKEEAIKQWNKEHEKTDLKCNLMYEGVYTKANIVTMLEDLKEQLREMHEDFFETEHFDEAYGVSNSMDIIQEKINALKEDKE